MEWRYILSMSPLRCFWRSLSVLSLLCLFSGLGHSAILDWDAAGVDWTPGGTSQSFNIGGTTVTISLTGNLSNFQANFPDDNVELTGGLAGQQSLQLWINSWTTNSQALTVTILFSTLVSNVLLPIYDIDRSGTTFQDQIRTISATDGTTTYAANISNTGSTANTVANNNTLTATITGSATATDSTAAGNATLSFTNPVNSITFSYGNGAGAQADPGQQAIALGDITFTVVPEPGTYFFGLFLVGVAFIHWSRRPFLKSF